VQKLSVYNWLHTYDDNSSLRYFLQKFTTNNFINNKIIIQIVYTRAKNSGKH
jgi:hypothetical protein